MSNKDEQQPQPTSGQFVHPDVICDALDKALQPFSDDGDSDGSAYLVMMDEYLRAYQELARFFHSLGVIFSFVAKDVDSKIHILQSYRSDKDIGHHYKSFQSMIKYEESENLLKDPKRPSGCRTVLRLHRALQFFSLFMEELAKVDGSSGSGPIAREAYKKTLAPYHSWVIQKSASLAMYKLPTRDSLIARAFGQLDTDHHRPDSVKDSESETTSTTSSNNDVTSEWKKQSEEMVRLGQLSRRVFDSAEKLFDDNNLLDLP